MEGVSKLLGHHTYKSNQRSLSKITSFFFFLNSLILFRAHGLGYLPTFNGTITKLPTIFHLWI